MHIIFKSTQPEIEKKYTVLDLDTFRFPDGSERTACCVIENIPITELPATENLKKMHGALIENYAQRNWEFCEDAIEQLMGRWGGVMDSFYTELTVRIENFKLQDPGQDWTPIIVRE
jgi:hypothetical protein